MSGVLHRTPSAVAAADGAPPYGLIGRRLIPFLLVCYLAALIDRLNLGFAKLQFLADLGLDEAVYGAAVGIAFISSVGAVGSFLSPTFIGWTRQATGSFTGAVDALAALMLLAMAVLWRTLPRPAKITEPPFRVPLRRFRSSPDR